MEISERIPSILNQFGLNAADFKVERIGSGHINHTFLISGNPSFVLQCINTAVFKKPERVAKNIRLAADYLNYHFEDYLFLSPIKTSQQEEMAFDMEGTPWRLFPYIAGSYTLNELTDTRQAFEAAKGFGLLTRNLDGISTEGFEPTIPDFHNLAWRFQQLQEAFSQSKEETRSSATQVIEQAFHFGFLADEYQKLIQKGILRERIVHNDTKINNILFDNTTEKALCVIDLDTLMQGFYIYDLGDMIRTFVSPVSEEEKDTSKICFRIGFYEALLEGYLSEMHSCLSSEEKKAVPFAGMMMTYIMAIRFLADYLNGNIYYQIHYPEQNLVRAGNQLKLLEEIQKNLRPIY